MTKSYCSVYYPSQLLVTSVYMGFIILYVVAQRCVPTIFDLDNLINLTLTNDADVSGDITDLSLDNVTLRDIEDGTVWVCVYVCMFVCMSMCVCACVCVLYVCMHVNVCVHACVMQRWNRILYWLQGCHVTA